MPKKISVYIIIALLSIGTISLSSCLCSKKSGCPANQEQTMKKRKKKKVAVGLVPKKYAKKTFLSI